MSAASSPSLGRIQKENASLKAQNAQLLKLLEEVSALHAKASKRPPTADAETWTDRSTASTFADASIQVFPVDSGPIQPPAKLTPINTTPDPLFVQQSTPMSTRKAFENRRTLPEPIDVSLPTSPQVQPTSVVVSPVAAELNRLSIPSTPEGNKRIVLDVTDDTMTSTTRTTSPRRHRHSRQMSITQSSGFLPDIPVDAVEKASADFKRMNSLASRVTPNLEPLQIPHSVHASPSLSQPTPIARAPGDRVLRLASAETIFVDVLYSTVQLNESGKEFTGFVIAVQDGDKILWRIQKRYQDFVELHRSLEQVLPGPQPLLPHPPSKHIFQGGDALSPLQADKRRATLADYLHAALKVAENTRELVLTFLATHVQDIAHGQEDRHVVVFHQSAIQEGYLTKKGRNFGAWKRRYFVLGADRLVYFESQEAAAATLRIHGEAASMENVRDGSRSRFSTASWTSALGFIGLQGARVAKQKQSANSASPFRHALMITEAAHSSSTGDVKRHIFCAESDTERDAWVQILARSVEMLRVDVDQLRQSDSPLIPLPPPSVTPSPRMSPAPMYAAYRSPIHGIPLQPAKMDNALEPPPRHDSLADVATRFSRTSRMIQTWKSRAVSSNADDSLPILPPQSQRVFGVPLNDSVEYASAAQGHMLPAVVYRCMEFLGARKAYLEEGIYRLSGGSAEIQNLKNHFEKYGDVELLKIPGHLDVHSVAGLFKLFLRELPESILTNELRRDFFQVVELSDRSDRVVELARLVSLLPPTNYTLLRTLIAHLITVVQHASVNKMSARNVGIVFSPTLGIPAGILTLLMAEFEFIFWVDQHKQSLLSAHPGHPVTTTNDKRKSWRASQVVVSGRSNRNSLMFLETAPEMVRQVEQFALDSKKTTGVQEELVQQEKLDMEFFGRYTVPPPPDML